MRLNYKYQEQKTKQLKLFIREQGISRKLLAKIKFQGGQILVNGTEENVLYILKPGDCVELVIPEEKGNDQVGLDETPLDILYEDEYLLIVNKPPYVPSVPVSYHLNGTMVNRVKAYLIKNKAVDQKVHTVTRLDKDTSGAMIFAKNAYTHALMDVKLRNHEIKKYYWALADNSHQKLEKYAMIDAPIARKEGSIIERTVSSNGKIAQTEYWLQEQYGNVALLKVLLHTGRTHQIRVHMQYVGAPLVGDTLYNLAVMGTAFQRQALHCRMLSFEHPVTKEQIDITAPLADDLQQFLKEIG